MERAEVFRNGYFFALFLLMLLGFCFITIGTVVFQQNSLPNVILIGCGISMAPSAIVAALFRWFLLEEIKYELTNPVITEVKEKLSPEFMKELKSIIENYQKEIDLLKELKEAGIENCFQHRKEALSYFKTAIEEEKNEIILIGSSLKGLIQLKTNKEISDCLKQKIASNINVKFLLTHPVVSDLRAFQESRDPSDIGKEIIESLQILKEWKVLPENIRLYKGAPTCFAIKTSTKMLLNPYAYRDVAYDRPCIIVGTNNVNSYLYNEFDKSHFGAWETAASVRIKNLDETIQVLTANLKNYEDNMKVCLDCTI